MDILSHGLWGGLSSKTIKKENRGNFWHYFFWGMFPDLFAFTIPFFATLVYLVSGGSLSNFDFKNPEQHIIPKSLQWTTDLSVHLYNFSHSLVIFALVFAAVWVVRKYWFNKTAYFPLIAWALHILCDIPTHKAEFYPTPVFFPISNARFTHGFSWAQPWFLLLDWGLLIVIYSFIYFRNKKK